MHTHVKSKRRSKTHSVREPKKTGVADGAGLALLDILALNVRTEIAFGQFTDGCTSLSWKGTSRSLLGQNWDWTEDQKENLVILHIDQPGRPSIEMVTEAGIIGKIGLNDRGVGVCFNAIRAKGLDVTRMPAHLGLRMALDSESARAAVEAMEAAGMASSAHALIADAGESIGLEFTSTTFARLKMDGDGRVYHSNHMLAKHPGVEEPPWLPHSPYRVKRIEELSCQVQVKAHSREPPTLEEFVKLFDDHQGDEGPICRMEPGVNGVGTLFNIVMDLTERRAVVRLGRPCMPEAIVDLNFTRERSEPI